MAIINRNLLIVFFFLQLTPLFLRWYGSVCSQVSIKLNVELLIVTRQFYLLRSAVKIFITVMDVGQSIKTFTDRLTQFFFFIIRVSYYNP